MTSATALLARGGCRVAIGDGAGMEPAALAEVLAPFIAAGGGDVLFGWTPHHHLHDHVDLAVLAGLGPVRALLGGYALRKAIDGGLVGYVPCRLGAVPALLHTALRRDVVIATVVRRGDGYVLSTESGWIRAALDAGAVLAGIERVGGPDLDAGEAFPVDRAEIVASVTTPPAPVAWMPPDDAGRIVGERVAALIPAGARVQVGPGQIGAAVLDALRVAVRVDSGITTESMMELDRRGLFLGASSPYVAGSAEMYEWAPGRAHVDRLEVTHDPARLAGDPPLFSVNTALEIDLDGQPNVEMVGGSLVAGIGGHSDYAVGAVRSPRGLSIVALPTARGRHATLVERLSAPASTVAHDIDAVVTERGVADLRGLTRLERRRAIAALWA